MLTQDLETFGLTHGEAKAYLTLLERGTSTVGPIAKGASISYSKIYEVLERLIEKGLVSTVTKEKTRHYQAVPPARIKEYLDEQLTEAQRKHTRLNELLPQLTKIAKSHPEHEAEVFLGWKGMRTAYDEFMRDLPTGTTIDFFGPPNVEEQHIIDKFYAESLDTLKPKQHKWRGIIDTSVRKTAFTKHITSSMQIRVTQQQTPSTIDIADDRVLFTTWSPKPTATLIRSPELAGNFKRYFQIVWESSKEYV